MRRNVDDRTQVGASASDTARALSGAVRPPAGRLRHGWGLSAKLLLLTVLFVMLAEVLIFVPSIANFRVGWLGDRLTAARLASLVVEADPHGTLPEALRNELLDTAQVRAIAIKHREHRKPVYLSAAGGGPVDQDYDLRGMTPTSWGADLSARFGLIADAVAVFFAPEGRVIRVLGVPSQGRTPGLAVGDFIEIVLPEAPLRAAMVRYALNILGLSIIISVITAALVYFALNGLFVQPMRRFTHYLLRFSENPEDASRMIQPSDRTDEIGTAERELANMQRELQHLLNQKNRLAQLGLAVSKINHDLRNMLASAQLISDRLGTLPDPTVQRFAPKLIASLARAINLCNDTLKYGKAEEAAPRREVFLLAELLDDVADGLGLPREPVNWRVEIDGPLRIDADRDHLFRVFNNLGRNAVQAIEGQGPAPSGEILIRAWREGRRVMIEMRDTGPGVPESARARLFRPFQAFGRKRGSGLGLAIAAELVRAHGGALRLLDTSAGAAFAIEIPDRTTAAG